MALAATSIANAACGRAPRGLDTRAFFAGPFDRGRFEAVVEQIRARPIPPGQEVWLRLDSIARDVPRVVEANQRLERGFDAGRIWATRTPEGHLKVVIETNDMGHAGEYGFAYSDVPLTPARNTGGWSTIDVPSKLDIAEAADQIDEHWWVVVNNLD